MMISTKGRYALRVMLDLADHNTGEYIPLKDIAQRQEISVKYLENILASLSRANLVDAIRGKGGGYRLCRAPEAYAAGEIIRLAEGSLATVSCLKGEKNGCEKAGHCRALPLWKGLDLTNKAVAEALDGLPAHKLHCSVLAEEAVKAALKDYYDRHNIAYDPKQFSSIDCEGCH